MKKIILIILISLLIFGFTLAQTAQINDNLLNQITDLFQKIIKNIISLETIPSLSSQSNFFPKGITPAIPLEKPITPEVIKQVLPDDIKKNDIIIQLNNLRITRIATSVSNAQAIFFAVRDMNWDCLIFENEKSSKGKPCVMNLRRPLALRELVIKITNDTILLQRNRQRAKLEDFQINDKINVYGFMDEDNYGIEALIIRKVGTKVVPLSFSPLPVTILPTPTVSPFKLPEINGSRLCVQVITPAYNPQNPSECKEFPTPCDVPEGWIKTNKCQITSNNTSIKVISPQGGELLVKGTNYKILWEKTDAPTVNIILEDWFPVCKGFLCPDFPAPSSYNIALNVKNTGVFEWKVGKDIDNREIPNGYYYINIVDSSGKWGVSDDWVNIIDPQTASSSIILISPFEKEYWKVGKTYEIKWISILDSSKKVRIGLYDVYKKKEFTIASSVPNTGSYLWTIPEYINNEPLLHTFESDFEIRAYIEDGDPKRINKSVRTFRIFAGEDRIPSVTVVSPNGGEILKEGQYYPIKWNTSNIPPYGKIDIELVSQNYRRSEFIARGLPATQKEYNWKVDLSFLESGVGSVAKGTKVLVKEGGKPTGKPVYVNIENIKKGDLVVTYILGDKKVYPSRFSFVPVVEVIKKEIEEEFKINMIVINKKLRVTPSHLVYTLPDGFKKAQDIKIGDFLLKDNGETEKVELIEKYYERNVETFDLVLSLNSSGEPGNYFADGYLVMAMPDFSDLGYLIRISSNWFPFISWEGGNVNDKSFFIVKPNSILCSYKTIISAYNPQNPSECKEFSNWCDVPHGWVKTNQCQIKFEY